jgi:hypothetical protein
MNIFKEKIESALKETGLAEKELISKLGYSKIEKAKRRYDELINDLNDPAELLKKIEQVLIDSKGEIKKAYEKEKEIRRSERERKSRQEFSPYLSVLTERRRPYSITMFALAGLGRDLIVELPGSVFSLPESEQMTIVQRKLRKHYAELSGEIPQMGRITGYVYHNSFDTRIHLGTEGEVLDSVEFTRDSKEIINMIEIK